MPRIYDNPKEKWEPTGETQASRKRPTLGNGPAGPSAQTENRATMVAIVVVMAIVICIALYRIANGAELQGVLSPPETTNVVYLVAR